ncbi:MAG TPA: iron transporter FeoB [Firmicutes bacterium]|jgi:ferrous iron transport protein B|nr:iron transporter FeoB [Bacillota bacterium]
MGQAQQERMFLNEALYKAEHLRHAQGENIHDRIVANIYAEAEALASDVVKLTGAGKDLDRRIDDIVTSRIFGFPLMFILLGLVFWLTITGANYPSALLSALLFGLEEKLTALFQMLGAPAWLHGIAVLGTYRSLAWVLSVMLPPMAIFFPIFTLLEDLGYLPRVAFNLDRAFQRVGAHGKQALTMSMGFGCNAAGVVAARIIDSPRERLIAILTNNFVPCNGRFPTLILLATIFCGAEAASISGKIAAIATVTMLVLTGVAVTLLVSRVLSRTLLKGKPSFFSLELPPYRKPQIGRVIIRSFLDRTIFVMGRAAAVAAPAGAVIWILANVSAGDLPILAHAAGLLDPLGRAVGLDGVIMLAFLLGLPANEIVIPIMLMSYLSTGTMLEIGSTVAMKGLLVSQGWTWVTALNMMLFSLLHFPCGTTLLTIHKETGSIKWAALAAVITTATAIIVCFLVAQVARLFNLI